MAGRRRCHDRDGDGYGYGVVGARCFAAVAMVAICAAASGARSAATCGAGQGEFNKDTRPMPSFALTNWADSILTWSGPRDNPNSDPVRPTGVTSFRISADYTSSAVAQDTFALIAGDDVYDNPLLWDGDVQLYTDGEFKTFMEVYNYSSITSRYCISRSYFLPPGENFYIVQYSISNVQNKDVTVSLLDYLETPSLSCSSYEVGKYSSTDDAFTVDMTACGQQMYLVYGVFGGTKIVTSYQVGSTSGSTSPLYQFSNYGSLSNQQQFSYTSISIGTQTTVTIPAESTTVLSFYRVLMPTMSDALSVNKRVQSQTAASWILQTEKSYSDWLAIAKKPTLDPLQESLYEISLLATKNSMNPTSGSFVASFHPAYAFKVWARDATFSAMILENAGYTEEPALFLKWLAGVELRDGGMGLHTCYSWFDGNPVGFVEPQYDSSGAALLAYYLHYKITGDTTVLQYAQSRIRQLEDFFLNNVEYGGLVPPDYSIWEESSDGITGDPIPPSHFTFTQSLAYAGIWSASLIESAVFGDSQRQQQLQARSESLGNALNTLLWVEGDKGYGYFARSLDATTHLPDTRVDGSTAAAIWTGACLNKTRGSAHIERIIANLTKLDYGIARYWGDPFFYNSMWNPGGQEVGEASPPWPVVTMFTSWAEIVLLEQTNIPNVNSRLQWMLDHVARGLMPAGEAIDGVSGQIVMSSCPDLYEFAGVYVYTVLMQQGLCLPPNPFLWD